VDHTLTVNAFQFRQNVGLPHFALEVATESEFNKLTETIRGYAGVAVEFMPELLGSGPRKHMIFEEPGGIRIEIIWPGT
jgi:lactoylglutathione lyase